MSINQKVCMLSCIFLDPVVSLIPFAGSLDLVSTPLNSWDPILDFVIANFTSALRIVRLISLANRRLEWPV